MYNCIWQVLVEAININRSNGNQIQFYLVFFFFFFLQVNFADMDEIPNFFVYMLNKLPSILEIWTLCNAFYTQMQLELTFLCNFDNTARTPIHQIIFPVGLGFAPEIHCNCV